MSAIEERDMRVASEIRERAEKEAKRKLESGELGSGPGGRGSVKVRAADARMTGLC
jgi:hypothetical protein